MSQRRQEARRAKQERRREERRAALRTTANRRPDAPELSRPTAPPPSSKGFWTTRNRWIAIGAVAAVIALALGFWIFRAVTAPLPGEKFPTQGNEHLSDIDQPHGEYNSNPPTSGWHLPPVPRPGIYTQDMRPEEIGHFMEHGGVWMLYNCPDGCPDDVARLQRIVNDAIDDGRPVALRPYSRMDSKFAVVAWQYLDKFDDLETGRVSDFINRHACRYNPEGGPYCTGVRGTVASPPADQFTVVPVVTPTSVFASPAAAPSPSPVQ